jgi:hypothetical protein
MNHALLVADHERHTAPSQGADYRTLANTVRDQLRHRELAMTLRYAHLSPDSRRQAVAAPDSAFGAESRGKSHPVR